MVLRFFNTLTGKKEIFEPLKKGVVKLYTCGPTVYDYAHIGNFRAYIFEDLLRRFLKYEGYKVIQVMNITDVDDKTIKNSNAQGVSLKEYTDKYTKAFFEDIKSLNVEPAEHYPRATEYIKEMIKLVRKLIEKGYAYESDGSIYYRISSFPGYGKLSKKVLEENIAGARVDSDEYEKEHVSDFVLWKKKKEDEPSWPSEFGDGRPGWHIECSAMSTKLLGDTLDIHTGGEDNIFPHHENEIAQSEGATGKQFVRYWLHCKFLLVNNEKMAKSKGNFYTLRDLLEKGYDPMAVRYLLISHNYRAPLNFTIEGLKQAEQAIKRLDDFFSRIVSYPDPVKKESELSGDATQCLRKIEEFLSDDLNISGALGALFDCVTKVNSYLDSNELGIKDRKELIDFFRKIEMILGLKIYDEEKPSREILKLVEERDKKRAQKDFKSSDELRKNILESGWMIKDSSPGEPPILKKRKRIWEN